MTVKIDGTNGIDVAQLRAPDGDPVAMTVGNDGKVAFPQGLNLNAVVGNQFETAVNVAATLTNYIGISIGASNGQSCMVGVTNGPANVAHDAIVTGTSVIVSMPANAAGFMEVTLTFPVAGTYLVSAKGWVSSNGATIRNGLTAYAIKVG